MYVEVQENGLCLLRYDPQRDQRFPSVFAAGRPGAGKRPSKKDGGATAGATAEDKAADTTDATDAETPTGPTK
jgi:hypothetical protein